MKGFRRSHHAFITAVFYELLHTEYGQKGKEVMILSVQRYAQQRGNRMAQRAIRDGKPLNHTTYKSYAEMGASDDPIKNVNRVLDWSPDQRIEITECPWATAFKELNAYDAAVVYCKNLDTSVIRGFNPNLQFVAEKVMPEADSCVHRYVEADFADNQEFLERNINDVVDMDYHCAHLYATYSKTATAILGHRGAMISAKVLERFAQSYGEQLANRISALKDIDFDYIYSGGQ